LKIQVFWNDTLFHRFRCLFGLLDPEEDGTCILRNVGKYSTSDTACVSEETWIFINTVRRNSKRAD